MYLRSVWGTDVYPEHEPTFQQSTQLVEGTQNTRAREHIHGGGGGLTTILRNTLNCCPFFVFPKSLKFSMEIEAKARCFCNSKLSGNWSLIF